MTDEDGLGYLGRLELEGMWKVHKGSGLSIGLKKFASRAGAGIVMRSERSSRHRGTAEVLGVVDMW